MKKPGKLPGFFLNIKTKSNYQAGEPLEVQYCLIVHLHDEWFAELPEHGRCCQTDHLCLGYGQTEENYLK